MTLNGGIYNMATLPKNGYKWSGYTEPFIADTIITGVLASNASLVFDGANDDAANTVADAMRIENTVDKNQVTYITLSEDVSNTDTVLKTLNDTQLVRVGDILEYLDGATVRLAEVTAVDALVVDTTVLGVKRTKTEYSVTVTPAMTLTTDILAGSELRTTGKTLDIGLGTLGADTKQVGERVTVVVAPVGTYAL